MAFKSEIKFIRKEIFEGDSTIGNYSGLEYHAKM